MSSQKLAQLASLMEGALTTLAVVAQEIRSMANEQLLKEEHNVTSVPTPAKTTASENLVATRQVFFQDDDKFINLAPGFSNFLKKKELPTRDVLLLLILGYKQIYPSSWAKKPGVLANRLRIMFEEIGPDLGVSPKYLRKFAAFLNDARKNGYISKDGKTAATRYILTKKGEDQANGLMEDF